MAQRMSGAEPVTDHPIVLFDGVCNLCNASVNFIIDRDPRAAFHFAPLQSDRGRELLQQKGLPTETLDTIVLIDRTGLNEVIGKGSKLTAVSQGEYVSPAEKPMLAYAKAVNLGAPPRPMVALVDPANSSIELTGVEDSGLKKELVFEVFQTSDFINSKQRRGTEPHDLASGDLNGDGIDDLVVLSQDKLLIYLGE